MNRRGFFKGIVGAVGAVYLAFVPKGKAKPHKSICKEKKPTLRELASIPCEPIFGDERDLFEDRKRSIVHLKGHLAFEGPVYEPIT